MLAGFVFGTIIGGYYTTIIGIKRLTFYGVILCMISGMLMILMVWSDFQGVYIIIVPQMIYYFGVGIVSPQCAAGALTPFPKTAGIASSLLGFFVIAVGAFSGILVGQTFDGTPFPMAVIIGTSGFLGYFAYKYYLQEN